MCLLSITILALETRSLRIDNGYSFICPSQIASYAIVLWAKNRFSFPLHDNSLVSLVSNGGLVRGRMKAKSKEVKNNLAS